MRVPTLLTPLLALAACSSTPNKDPNPTPDAPGPPPSDAPRADAPPPTIDAAIDAPPPAATVIAVTCPATPAGAITADNRNDFYMPSSVTITVGQIVRFSMPTDHNVTPNDTMSDPGLSVNYSETKCLMFTLKGTFGFHCVPHLFTGTVVVQ
jgi:plastocyanin